MPEETAYLFPINLFPPGSDSHYTPQDPVAAALTVTMNGEDLVLTAPTKGNLNARLSVVDPGAADAEASIEVSQRTVIVSLATDSEGVPTTTLAEIVALINGDTDAAALFEASTTGTVELVEAGDYDLEGGVDGPILKRGQAYFDEDYIYLAIGDTTADDASNMRTIALGTFPPA